MPYVGRQPSAVPVTADDIPDNSIDASKIKDGSIELADISDNSITDAKLNSTKLDGIESGAQVNPTFKTVGGAAITGSGEIDQMTLNDLELAPDSGVVVTNNGQSVEKTSADGWDKQFTSKKRF